MATFNAPDGIFVDGVSRPDGQQLPKSALLSLILINLQDKFSFLIEQVNPLVNPLNVSAKADNII